MSLDWTLGDVASWVGTLMGDPELRVHAVATDSRTVGDGDLFVAITGDSHDGHDYVADALTAGAVAAVVEAGRTTAQPRIEVAATLTALRDLAAKRRSELAMPVVAITGSTGKTTTKDMLASAIPGAWASPASYNNEIGVPLTVLQTPSTAQALVVEMGSRGRGHLEWLMPAVRPQVAVITNIGVVHLETFGDVDTLVESKWELVAALGRDGVAVLPANDARLARSHRGQTVTFGVESAGDVVARDVEFDDGRAHFTLDTPQGQRELRLQLPGLHQPANAAAAAAAALAVGIELDAVVAGLGAATGSKWRMEIHRGRFTVINDAYNANPTSVESALRTTVGLGGRPLAILGRMAELGDVAEAEHIRIGRLAASLGFAVVIMVGEDPGLADGAGSIAQRVGSPEEALDVVAELVRPGDNVLVKASRAVGLEELAEQLVDLAAANAGSAA